MGKRSNYDRKERDFYPTPYEAVLPLLSHLPKGTPFVEPCAGDGALVRHLTVNEMLCQSAFDIEPQDCSVKPFNALDRFTADLIITNPPWQRELLHKMILHFRSIAPSWLLFDVDWMHTKQAAGFLDCCSKIVSVGRVSWMGNNQTGMDNCCWYLFEQNKADTVFYGRESERCRDTLEMFDD